MANSDDMTGCEKFVSLLLKLPTYDQLEIAQYWTPIELSNLEVAVPQAEPVVDLTLQDRKEFKFDMTYDFDRQMQLLLRCGPKLRLVDFRWFDARRLTTDMMKQLAANCPNIEHFENTRFTDWMGALLDYAKELRGRCKLKVFEFENNCKQSVFSKLQLLNRCCAISTLNVAVVHDNWKFVLEQIQHYVEKRKVVPLHTLIVDMSWFAIFSVAVVELFKAELKLLHMKYTPHYRSNEAREKVLGCLRGLVDVDLNIETDSLEALLAIRDDRRVVELMLWNADATQDVWNQLTKKKFASLQRLRLGKTRFCEQEAWNRALINLCDKKVFPRLKEITIVDIETRGEPQLLQFFRDRGHMVKDMELRVYSNHVPLLTTIVTSCKDIRYGRISISVPDNEVMIEQTRAQIQEVLSQAQQLRAAGQLTRYTDDAQMLTVYLRTRRS